MSTMTSPRLNEVHDADLALLADTKSGAWKVIAGDRRRPAGRKSAYPECFIIRGHLKTIRQ
jgi:hypothetical protein